MEKILKHYPDFTQVIRIVLIQDFEFYPLKTFRFKNLKADICFQDMSNTEFQILQKFKNSLQIPFSMHQFLNTISFKLIFLLFAYHLTAQVLYYLFQDPH